MEIPSKTNLQYKDTFVKYIENSAMYKNVGIPSFANYFDFLLSPFGNANNR
jgi:hypothetical protein